MAGYLPRLTKLRIWGLGVQVPPGAPQNQQVYLLSQIPLLTGYGFGHGSRKTSSIYCVSKVLWSKVGIAKSGLNVTVAENFLSVTRSTSAITLRDAHVCPTYSQVAPRNRRTFNSAADAEVDGYRRAENCL